MAKDAGLDVERLRKDMDAPEIADAIIGNFNLARALRITLTPTFIIGNRMVTESSATLDFGKAVGAARAAKWTAGAAARSYSTTQKWNWTAFHPMVR